MLTLEKFEEASEKVKEVTLETKLIYSDFLSEQTGNKVYLKPENMQFTGAYKVRGAYYKISTLSDEEREKGLITASAGNHAQGVAYAAKCYGVKATIVMPTTTPLIKVNRTKSYGAEVVLYGDVYDEACAKAYELAEENVLREQVAQSDILGNATPVGMGKMEGKSPVNDLAVFRPGLSVIDVIYHPDKTKFLEMAESCGCKIMNGKQMLLYQGAKSFSIWTGKEMPLDVVAPIVAKHQ